MCTPTRPSTPLGSTRAPQEGTLATERRIDLGEPVSRGKIKDPTTFGDLIDLHATDMKDVLQAPRRSKAFTLDALKTKLGKLKLEDLTRERLIQFGKDRTKEGAGPVTISMDIGYIKRVVSHATAVHGIRVRVEPIDLARIALKRLGPAGKGREADRGERKTRQLSAHLDGQLTDVLPWSSKAYLSGCSLARKD